MSEVLWYQNIELPAGSAMSGSTWHCLLPQPQGTETLSVSQSSSPARFHKSVLMKFLAGRKEISPCSSEVTDAVRESWSRPVPWALVSPCCLWSVTRNTGWLFLFPQLPGIQAVNPVPLGFLLVGLFLPFF